jgi:hypothetical protein
MAKNPIYKTLQFESLTLTAWMMQGRTMVNLTSVSKKHFDQMRLAAHAGTYFQGFLDDTPHGVLFDIRALSALLHSVGLESLAGGLPQLPPDAPKAVPSLTVRPIQPRMRVDYDISPDRIRHMYGLMQEGHSQSYAAGMAGLGEATASRLRRGRLSQKMNPEAIRAWNETFGQHAYLQKTLVKGASQPVDEKNAALIPQLYQLVRIKNMSFAAAGKILGISASKAYRLATGTYKSAGIKTHTAYKSSFQNRPET